MVKKLIAVLLFVAALPLAAFAQTKIGVVDIDSIRAAMPETAAAYEKLAAISRQYEEEYTKLTDEINKKVEEYQSMSGQTYSTIKEHRQQEIQDLDQRIQAFQQTAQKALAAERRACFEPIDAKIFEAIKAIGDEMQFSIIQQCNGVVYTGTDVIDITDLVKTRLGIN